jgi:OHCU decarboxylase
MSLASSWCRWGLSEDLAWFNGLPRDEAKQRLRECCGSHAWAAAVAARRPYADLSSLVRTSDDVWGKLTPADWLEAFAAHPRLGDRGGDSPDASRKEQSQVMQAGGDTLAELAVENRRYEAHFGHVFLLSAAGRTAEDVLAALRRRIDNDAAIELEVAAEEQRKITRLRLASMLSR